MKLILLRHAKSDWSTGSGDHDRPLNPRGQADAPRIGKWLRDSGHAPTRVLCSTAARTRETLARMRLQGAEISYLAALYEALASTILSLAGDYADDTLLIVGHNPGMADAAARASAERPTHSEFSRYPTCACTVVDVSAGLPGPVLDFAVPQDL